VTVTGLAFIAGMCLLISGLLWILRNGQVWVAEDRILAYLRSGPKDIQQIHGLMGESGTIYIMEAVEILIKKNKICYSDIDDKYPCVMIELT